MSDGLLLAVSQVIYFLGALALMTSCVFDRISLLRLFKTPQNLDESIALRFTWLMSWLLLTMHIFFSALFYAFQAAVTDSSKDAEALAPFATAAKAWVAYVLIIEPVIGGGCLRRKVSAEESGTGDKLYQDAADTYNEKYGTPMPNYAKAAELQASSLVH